MAHQGQETESTRGSRGGVGIRLKIITSGLWEYIKMFLATLLVFAINPLSHLLFFGYLGFLSGAEAVKAVDGNSSAFAFFAICALTDLLIVVVSMRSLYRRWTR